MREEANIAASYWSDDFKNEIRNLYMQGARYGYQLADRHQELTTRLYNLVNAVDVTACSKISSEVSLRLSEARETLKKVIQ